MRIEETYNNGIGILSLSGNLVMEEMAELKDLIRPYLDNQKYNGLICNLNNVNEIDSSGIGVIVSIYKSLRLCKRKFALSGLSDKNRTLFNMSKLDRVLIIAQNDEAATQILEDLPESKRE